MPATVESALAQWSEEVAAWRASRDAARWDALRAQREQQRASISSLLQRFREGERDLDAFRRRFAFVDLPSAAHTDRFADWLVGEGLAVDLAGRLRAALGQLNQRIRKDPNLGPGFCVGHSYFCGVPEAPSAAWVQQVIRAELLPLIREYWVDDRAQQQAAEELLDLGD